jgi:hypothetical protein
MNSEFNTKEELFNRVRPALNIKEKDLKKLGYSNITSLDIWNYLIESKWSKSRDLVLSDIVDDILNVDIGGLNQYLKNK